MPIYRFKTFQFNSETGQLNEENESFNLRPKTAALLAFLLKHPEELLTKKVLMDEVWPEVAVSDNTLMQGIQELRKCLGDRAKDPTFIKTWPMRGYQWLVVPNASGSSIGAKEADDSQNREGVRETKWGKIGKPIFLVLVLGYLAWIGVRQSQKKALLPKKKLSDLVIHYFENETGDASLDWMRLAVPAILSDELNKAGLQTHIWKDATSERLVGKGVPFLTGVLNQSEQGKTFHWNLRIPPRHSEKYAVEVTHPSDGISHIVTMLVDRIEERSDDASRLPKAAYAYAQGIRILATTGAAAAKPLFEEAESLDSSFARAALMTAFCLEITGDVDGSRIAYERALLLTNRDLMAHLTINRNLGRLALNTARLEDAIEHLQTAKREATAMNLEDGEILNLLRVAKVLNKEKNGLPMAQDATSMPELPDLTTTRLRLSPMVNWAVGQADLQSDLHRYRELEDRHNQAVVLVRLANSLDTGFSEKQVLLEEALALFSQVGYRRGTARVLSDMGFVALAQNQVSAAAEHLDQALDIYRSLKDPFGEAKTLFYLGLNTLLGQAQGSQNGNQLAHRYFTESLEVYRRFDLNIRLIPVNHIGLGIAERGMGSVDQAASHFETAAQLSRKLGQIEDQWLAHLSLMVLDMDEGRYKKALLRSGPQNNEPPALWLLYRARCQYLLGQFKPALKNVQKAREIDGDRWRAGDEAFLNACKMASESGEAKPLPPLEHPLIAYFRTRARSILSQ